MAGLARQRSGEARPEQMQEWFSDGLVESKAGRKLDQQRPQLGARTLTSSRKQSRRSAQSASRRSCVIAFGSFTAKRKSAGTAAAQRTYVCGLCERWKVELISALVKRAA